LRLCKFGRRATQLAAHVPIYVANLFNRTPTQRREPLRTHAACPGAQEDQSLI